MTLLRGKVAYDDVQDAFSNFSLRSVHLKVRAPFESRMNQIPMFSQSIMAEALSALVNDSKLNRCVQESSKSPPLDVFVFLLASHREFGFRFDRSTIDCRHVLNDAVQHAQQICGPKENRK
jgi:hypothetical protein